MEREIKSKEYEIVAVGEDTTMITKDLNDEVALTFFAFKLGFSGMGRNLSESQLSEILSKINPNNIKEAGLIKIRLVGGDISDASTQYIGDIAESIKKLDNGANSLEIISFDVGERIHPNSIRFNCYHNGIYSL